MLEFSEAENLLENNEEKNVGKKSKSTYIYNPIQMSPSFSPKTLKSKFM